MPKSKKSKRKPSLSKSLEKVLPGFWMRFSLLDPIGDHDKPLGVKVGHKNPVIMLKLRDDLYWEQMRQVIQHRPAKWRMEITMEFKQGEKSEFKTRELVGYGRLPDIDDDYQSTIEDMFEDAVSKNYIGQYVETYVVQEVISGQSIKDEDFSE